MTTMHGESTVADPAQPDVPADPLALEARLAAARLRRSSALAEQSAAARDARPPAPVGASVPPPHRHGGLAVAAAFAGGFGLAALLGALAVGSLARREQTSPLPPVALADPAMPAVLAAAPLALPVAPTAAEAPPMPRPAGLQRGRPAGAPVRSARNAPAGVSPPQALRMIVRDLYAATIGRTAGALGLAERVDLPGVAVTLDRRGLRLHERPARR